MSGTKELLQNPKESTNGSRAEAIKMAAGLLAQAAEKIRLADGLKDDADGLAGRLSSLRKKSIRAYWEAGRLLTRAREAAPHGSWGKLRDAAGLAATTEYLWRDLYRRFEEDEIDRLADLGYSISRLIDEYQVGRRKAGQPQSFAGPGHEAEAGRDEDVGEPPSVQPDDKPEPPRDALRVWQETRKGSQVVHAANWRGKVLCTGRLIDGAADSPGDESDITCVRCLGIRTRSRLDAERRERARTPHGSEIGYVWEILDGDEPEAIDARWLPIREVHGQVIVTPEKTFGPGSAGPVFGDRAEALESAKAKYQQIVERDRAEIERLKAEQGRLRLGLGLAEKKLARVESLLAREA